MEVIVFRIGFLVCSCVKAKGGIYRSKVGSGWISMTKGMARIKNKCVVLILPTLLLPLF